MGKQRSLSNEEKTRIYAQNDHIAIPAQKATRLKNLCLTASSAAFVFSDYVRNVPGVTKTDLEAAVRDLNRALNSVDYQFQLSVPGEYPAGKAA
jgi:hypothetical protein